MAKKNQNIEQEKEILKQYIISNKLRNTPQRYFILEVFLTNEGHLSTDELHDLVKAKYPEVSHSTTFRTLKIIEKAGLGTIIRGEDGVIRYEHLYQHENHGHLICSKCGSITEYDNSEIIKLQSEIAKQKDFHPLKFGARISGLCKKCQQNHH